MPLMMPRVETRMAYNLLRPDFLHQVQQAAEPGLGNFSYPVIDTSGTQVPERPMNRDSTPPLTHSPNGGGNDTCRRAFKVIGPEPDLDTYAVFEDQIYVPVCIAPGHVDKNMPNHGTHRSADFMTFQGAGFRL
jgi:hypothetical protein